MFTRSWKFTPQIILFALLVLSIGTTSRRAVAQEDISDFSQTFEVFMQSRDAYRLYDLAPDDVVFSLPPSYEIGPGDLLQIILTGMINDALIVQVGPQGDVFVPPAGLIEVEGMTVEKARNIIDDELAKLLVNYKCAVQLLKARKIQVYLLGQVRQPGLYISLAGTTTVSLIQVAGTLALNPATIALDEPAITHPYFRALTSGAGRWIEIWRDGDLVGKLDLADVAIRGRIQGDIILEDGDAIYVAPNTHPVIIRGGVTRPGTYEIHPDDTVFDLLAQAGGYRSMMMLGSVDVERANPAGRELPGLIITLDLMNPEFNPLEFQFQPGDILRVPEARDQVYVLGAVWMPQAVDYHEGWNVLDYIAQTGGPVSPSDHSDIRIISFPLSRNQTDFYFNFKNLYLGCPIETVPIEPGDMIWVPWKNQPFYGPGLTNSISVLLGQSVSFLRLLNDL